MSRLDLLAGIAHMPEGGGVDLATTQGTEVATGASATNGVFGSWVELIAANHADTNMIKLGWKPQIATSRRCHVNIGIGAAGSERIIVEGISFNAVPGAAFQTIPCRIPRGARVAVQAGSDQDWQIYYMSAETWHERGIGNGYLADSTYVSGGSDVTATDSITLPTADNSWGAWSQLSSATAKDGDEVYLFVSTEGRTGGEGAENCIFQLGIGAAGSEVAIGEPSMAYLASWDDYPDPCVWRIKTRVPAGSRLAVRAQSDNIVAHTAYTLTCMWSMYNAGEY